MLLAQDFGPNRSKSKLLHFGAPPLRSAIRRDSPPGRGVQLSQNLFKKKHFWNNSRCVAGPGCLSKLLPIEAPSLLGPPLPATNTSRFASGEGGGKRLKICAKIRFLSKSRCVAGPGFSSKLIQIEASSLLGGLAGAPVWPEFHRSGLLGCMTAAEL